MMLELRPSLRRLLREKTHTAIIVLALSAAISVTTTSAALFDALAWPRTDVLRPDEIHFLQLVGDPKRRVPVAARNELLRKYLGSEMQMEGERRTRLVVDVGPESRPIFGALVTTGYFRMLNVRASVGRVLQPQDGGDKAGPVMVSERLWRQLAAVSPGELPTMLRIDGIYRPIAGVLGRESELPSNRTDVWMFPARSQVDSIPLELGRVTAASLLAFTKVRQPLLAEWARMTNQGVLDVEFRMRKRIGRPFQLQRFHVALGVAIAALLIVVYANVLSLQIARGIARTHDVAVRLALGARMSHILRLFAAESAWLTCAALILGGALTVWLMRGLGAAIPGDVAGQLVEARVSWRVLAVATALAVGTLALVALAPAWRLSRVSAEAALKNSRVSAGASRNRFFFGSLCSLQVGATLLTTVLAATLIRSANIVGRNGLGYDSKDLYSAIVIFDQKGSAATASQALNAVGSLPGVKRIGARFGFGTVGNSAITVLEPGGSIRQHTLVYFEYPAVDHGYLPALGLRVLKGRNLLPNDPPGLVLVDEALAKRLWQGVSPIGRRIRLGDAKSNLPFHEVVGVFQRSEHTSPATDFRRWRRDEEELGSLVISGPPMPPGPRGPDGMELVFRGQRGDPSVPARARTVLLNLPGVSIAHLLPWEAAEGLVEQRSRIAFVNRTFTFLAIAAAFLTIFGIYATATRAVQLRRDELAVRAALGASPRHLGVIAAAELLMFILFGIAIGLWAAPSAVGLVEGFVFVPNEKHNVFMFASLALLTLGLATGGLSIPIRNAMRIRGIT